MRFRELALGAIGAGLVLCLAQACGGDDEDAVIVIKKDSGTGGKDSGTGGKDAGKDSSSGGSAGEAGTSGAAGGGGTSGAAGGGGAAGAAGEGGGAGAGGSGGTKPDSGTGGTDAGKCEDNAASEPNNSEATAAAASPAVCGGATKEQAGVIAAADTDWYDYSGSIALCATAPTVKVDHPSLRACVFVECASTTTTVTCAQGSTATSPDGLKGCCASGGNEAAATVACGITLNNTVDVHMRVDQSPASPAACFAYKLSYSL